MLRSLKSCRPPVLGATLVLLSMALWTSDAAARVKLITLPVRERVEVQLEHPNATLVEEERIVPLVKGENQVDFSWANTRIDPRTIVFRMLGPAQGFDGLQANVLSVSYPPGENALVWQVSSNMSGSARVRISYLLGGLTETFSYRAIAGEDEKTLTLSQYVQIRNFANEAYDDSRIDVGFGERFQRAIGLDQTQELRLNQFAGVPVEKTYTVNATQTGYLDRPQDKLNVALHYVLRNDREHRLGGEPLPAGKVRIFQKDPQGTTAFLGEDMGAYTPVDDRMKLFLGLAQDVVVKRTISDRQYDRVVGNLYDVSVTVRYEIENFKKQPVTVRIEEMMQPLANESGRSPRQPLAWQITAGNLGQHLVKDETDLHQAAFDAPVPAGENDQPGKATFEATVIFKNNFRG